MFGLAVLAALIVVVIVVGLRSLSKPVVDGDLAVIEQLREVGSNLAKPHDLEFFLYFPTEEKARAAQSQLSNDGFVAKVELGADNKNWLCFATQTLVPTHERLAAMRVRLEGVASTLGGEYDGWGSGVVE